jgi:hypothetical protein
VVEAVVLKAIEKDRDRRYQTATDFAAALREAAKSPAPPGPPVLEVVAPGPVPSPADVPAPTTGVPPWRARRAATETPAGTPLTPPPAGDGAPPAGPPATQVPRPAPTFPGSVAAAVGRPTGVETTPSRVPTESAERSRRREPEPRRIEPHVGPRRRGTTAGDGAAAGLATAMWGLRHVVSWGMQAAAVVCAVRFGWSLVAPLVGPATVVTLEAWGRPWAQPVIAWLPALTVAGLDVAPIIAAVVLVTGRSRLVARLADLEARWRVPVRPDNLPG